MARGIAHRDWALHRSDFKTDADFRLAVEQEMALNVHMMDRLGVAIVSAPVRRQVDGSWFNEAVVFRTASVPGIKEPDAPASPVVAVPVATPDARWMVGPGGEEEEVPESEWPARLAANWEFDDEEDDTAVPESLLERAE